MSESLRSSRSWALTKTTSCMLKIPFQTATLASGWPGNWMKTHRIWGKGRSQVNTCESSFWLHTTKTNKWSGDITEQICFGVFIRMDQEFYRRHGLADMKDDNSTNKTMSAAARRSFFRRRLKHKRSGSKDGKDLMALDAISTDSLPITEGETPSTDT